MRAGSKVLKLIFKPRHFDATGYIYIVRFDMEEQSKHAAAIKKSFHENRFAQIKRGVFLSLRGKRLEAKIRRCYPRGRVWVDIFVFREFENGEQGATG